MLKRLTIVAGLMLVAVLAHAVFVLPDQITVAGRVDPDGVLRTDVVQDGVETETPVSTLLFSETFDAQPDWATTGRRALPPNLPIGWDSARTDEAWHPADGDIGSKPSMLISGNDPSQVYGGTGKAFITYTESIDLDGTGWGSDGFIVKDIPPTNEVFFRFKIKFQPGWNPTNLGGQMKVFRVMSWDGPSAGNGSRNHFGASGNTAPMYIYNWAGDSMYGVRHFHAFRCDAQTTNYYCESPSILDRPREINAGDMSGNYTSNIAINGAQLPDLLNGGWLSASPDAIVWHNQVLGDVWHVVEFHFKLNSAPGVRDGIFQHWLDGQKLVDMRGMPWIGTSGSMDAKWNSFSIGGNDHFQFNMTGPLSDRERWYAIDDIAVHSTAPLDRQ